MPVQNNSQWDPALSEPLTTSVASNTTRVTPAVIIKEDVECNNDATEEPLDNVPDHEPEYVKRLRQIPLVGHLLVLGSCLTMTIAAALIKVSSDRQINVDTKIAPY